MALKMPSPGKFVAIVLALVGVVASAAYLHDPPWAGRLTSGMRTWEEDPPGTRFRWTTGRASFFVPSGTSSMILPMRAVFPGPNGAPVVVKVMVDDRWLADVELCDPTQWVNAELPLPRRRTSRRFRRIDLLVGRAIGPYLLGVMVGDVRTY